ncbi:uncharacterized protein LOC118416553 [Branchiostoma floridae]|uniref:Uncharacterized protein LOC118416553 n=1 Tax=Branchiostoma floridae TaxID=7739 RepID=A0A9J7MSV1_BRAFL|nr:uncharacterized protein LOC118416553 [Branchiostoma floridae]
MQRQDIQEVRLIHAGEDQEALLKPLATAIEKYLKQQDLVTYETFTTHDAGSESVSEKVAEAIRDAKGKKIPSAVIISKKFLSTLFLNKNKDQLIELLVDDHSYSVLVPIWLGVDEEEIKRYSSRLASKRPVRGEHYTPHSHNFQILAETLVMAWLGKYIPSEGDDSIAENHPEHLRSREPVESEDPSSVEEQPVIDVSGEDTVDTRPSDLPRETATNTEGRPANLQQEENESASCAAAMAGSGLHTNYAEGLDKLDISEEGAKKGDGAGADPTQPHPSDLPNEAAASGEARLANQQQEEEGDSSCSDKAIGAGGCHMDPEKGLSYLNRDAEDSCHGSQGVPSMGSRNAATACAPAAAATRQPAAPIAGGEASAPTVPAGPAAAGEQVQARSAPGKPDKPKPANIPIGGPLNDSTDKELKSPIPVNGHDNKEHRCPTSEGIVPPNAFYVGTSDPSQDTPSPPQDPQAEYMVDLGQDILDDLKMKLDPQMPLIKNWRNFGSRNGLKNQDLNYIDYCARQGQSPTVAIFQKLSHLTIKKFKEDCKFYKRMDVLEVMKRHGY